MQVKAIAKSVRVSPRKIRLVADAVKHLSIPEALAALQASNKRAATPLAKVLTSALANAINNAKLDKEKLMIKSINVTESGALKRFRPSTRGRTHPYKRRGANILVVLAEEGDAR